MHNKHGMPTRWNRAIQLQRSRRCSKVQFLGTFAAKYAPASLRPCPSVCAIQCHEWPRSRVYKYTTGTLCVGNTLLIKLKLTVTIVISGGSRLCRRPSVSYQCPHLKVSILLIHHTYGYNSLTVRKILLFLCYLESFMNLLISKS